MDDRYNNINKILDKLDFINDEKFSSINFNDLNNEFENEINHLRSITLNEKNIVVSDYKKDVVSKLLAKIENLESKIVPKARLFDDFSSSRN